MTGAFRPKAGTGQSWQAILNHAKDGWISFSRGGYRMDIEELVKAYIDAWNRQDVTGLIDLMHPGAAYYDAFWMESCVGSDLTQYFKDAMDVESYWYEQVGDVITTEMGVVFRYSAHDRSDAGAGNPILFGADVLVFRDNKILTVTDFYCSPDRVDLEGVAQLAAERHGVSSHMQFGLSAFKSMRLKASLSDRLDKDQVYLDPNMSLAKLAEEMGCSLAQLSVVIGKYFETDAKTVLDARRIRHARELLQDRPAAPNTVERAAALSGFNSKAELSEKFTEKFGITPMEFCRRQNTKDAFWAKSKLH